MTTPAPATPAATEPARHKVVVIGSGFGGLFATQALKRADCDVTMISKTTMHLFQPLLYQVATGILSSGEIAPATREILRRQRNAQVLLGEVTDIDLQARTVTSMAAPGPLVTPYDSLIVAAGAGQSYFGNDHFAEFAPGMKTVDDALELRGRIFGSFELAERSTDPVERERFLTFVVIGAGPTGVEMAGQIVELCQRALRKDFRRIDTTQARVVLLDAAPAVLGAFGPKLSEDARGILEGIGVEVLLGAKVVGLDADGVTYETPEGVRGFVPAACKIWAAGVAASPLAALLAERSGAEVDRAGRILVQPDLTVPGHPEVFVVGDMAALDDLPGVAQVAIQGGRHAAATIRARLRGQPEPGPFRYHDKGSMATITRFSAVAKVQRVETAGFLAWLLWLAVHLVYIVGFKKRLTTLLHWAVSFLGRTRSERTTTPQQVVARNRLRADRDAPPVWPGAVGERPDVRVEDGGTERPRPTAA
ncbi:MAG: NAD(P)/FAD-dependent oxidoreductase [Candidatus Nanopelagicales bacterium]|nr:NAD(P)/FAD-dependent oxidoreductase [Candidatus Nanopelagicales bacterium]